MPIGYLFTDIEGSTERWERAPEQMTAAVKRQNAIISDSVTACGGAIHDRAGDGVFAIFASGNPLQCALDIQLAMQREDWSAVGGLELRLGVHIGQFIDGAVVDQASVNRAARIMASGWGGQIVVSGEAMSAYRAPDDATFVDLGVCHLQGIDEPLRLSGLAHPLLEKNQFPPLRSHLIQSPDLPRFSGPFIGREGETAEILARLSVVRLLTIVGPGGTGKTRLSSEVAEALALTRPVVFVSLDTVASELELVSAIAAALRFPFHGSERPETQLIGYLRNRRTLLVLDNADAIAGHSAFLHDLVSSCGRLTILATGREPLRAESETLYRLGGLSFEEGSAGVFESPAHQLFTFEAGAQGVSNEYGNEDAQTLLEIYRIVDGSPLALRLVARWSRLLSLGDMLEQLRRDSSFLSDGDGSDTSLTLRGVFEGSWRMLNGKQQIALARLSVFAGPLDWSAAKHVANVDLATYGALADKSLLDESAQHTFLIHPLIRGYARQKLAATPDEEAVTLRRHADYYLDMVRANAVETAPGKREAALDELQANFSDIRAAWLHANALGSERVRKTVLPLHHFLTLRSLLREGIALFGLEPKDGRAKQLLRGARAACLFQHSDFKSAEEMALGVYRARGEILARAYARDVLGSVAYARGDYPSSRRHYERAFKLWSSGDGELNASYSVTSLALLRFAHGDRAEVATLIKQAFRLSRKAGNTQSMLLMQMLAGDLARWEGRPGAAKINYDKALRLEAGRIPQVRAGVLRRLGSLSRQMGDPSSALRYHRESMELATEVGEPRSQAHAFVEIGEDLAALTEFDEARTSLMDGLRLAMSLNMQPLLAQGSIALAQLELRQGERRRAEHIAATLNGRALGDLKGAYDALLEELDCDAGTSLTTPGLGEILDDIADDIELGSFDSTQAANPAA